jgi:hypothetical protein
LEKIIAVSNYRYSFLTISVSEALKASIGINDFGFLLPGNLKIAGKKHNQGVKTRAI